MLAGDTVGKTLVRIDAAAHERPAAGGRLPPQAVIASWR